MNLSVLTRVARHIVDVIAECNHAQNRMLALRMAPDTYLIDGGAAADSYAEFLFRASGPCPHEPSADRRAHGQPVA
jgi:hypothetical protein